MTFFPCSYRITLIQMPRLSRLRRLQPLKVETSKNQLQKLKQQVIFYFNYPHQISLSEVRVNTVQLLIPCVILPDSDNGSSSTQIPSGDERWISTPSVSPPPQRFPRACFMCVRAIEDQEAFDKHMEEHRNMPLLHCIICKKGFLNEKLLVLHKQVIHPNLCEICNLELESTRMQIDHMLEYHPDVVDDIPFGEWHAGIVCLTLILRSNFNVLTSGLMFAINVFNHWVIVIDIFPFKQVAVWLLLQMQMMKRRRMKWTRIPRRSHRTSAPTVTGPFTTKCPCRFTCCNMKRKCLQKKRRQHGQQQVHVNDILC